MNEGDKLIEISKNGGTSFTVLDPAPQSMQVDISDIDGQTTRNAKGYMLRDRIGTKRKLNLTFPPMSTAKISALLQLVEDEFFLVKYLDPFTGTVLTKEMYVGDRNSPMYKYGTGGTDVLWESLKMNFIER